MKINQPRKSALLGEGLLQSLGKDQPWAQSSQNSPRGIGTPYTTADSHLCHRLPDFQPRVFSAFLLRKAPRPRPCRSDPPGVFLWKLPLPLHVEHEVSAIDVLYDQEQAGEKGSGSETENTLKHALDVVLLAWAHRVEPPQVVAVWYHSADLLTHNCPKQEVMGHRGAPRVSREKLQVTGRLRLSVA